MKIPFDIAALKAAVKQKYPNIREGWTTDEERALLPHVVCFKDVSPDRLDYYRVLPAIRAKLMQIAGNDWLLEARRSHGGAGPVVDYEARLQTAEQATELRCWWSKVPA